MTAQPPHSIGDAIRESLPSYEAPAALREWARAQAESASRATAGAQRGLAMRRLAYAAGLVLAVTAGWVGQRAYSASAERASSQRMLVAALVDTHVRSLMVDHLVDVPSSDHHTVKPWFAGKVPFSPHVPELQDKGFALIGGRVEFIAGHTAAALVYKRGAHTINLFIWPASEQSAGPPFASYQAYSLVHWTDRDLSYWAVSDAAAPELEAFERAYAAASQ
jgi:anti-sigma factor RsiW